MMRCSKAVMRTVLAAALLVAPSVARADEEVVRLLSILAAGSPGESERAIERLRYIGAERTATHLQLMLVAPEASKRIAASSALARLNEPKTAPALAKALASDEDWEVRRNAADALGSLKAKSQRAALEKALRLDSNRRVRKSCVLALGRLDGSGKALVRSAGSDPDLEVRLSALDALARTTAPTELAPLRRLLSDESQMVNFAAARALAWRGDGAGQKFLVSALESKDEELARRALLVLSDIPKDWALARLLSLSAKSEPLAVEAAVVLARRGDERGLKALVNLEPEGGPVGQAASAALDSLGVDNAARARLAESP